MLCVHASRRVLVFTNFVFSNSMLTQLLLVTLSLFNPKWLGNFDNDPTSAVVVLVLRTVVGLIASSSIGPQLNSGCFAWSSPNPTNC
jgi:hypothetical protein